MSDIIVHRILQSAAEQTLQVLVLLIHLHLLSIIFFIRLLDMHYPHFPVEKELTDCILQRGVQQHKLQCLAEFTTELQCLQLGSTLLPDLVEFRHWLHVNVAQLVTREQATSSITIGQVIKRIQKNPSMENISNLYQRVKKSYNQYKLSIGKSLTRESDTPLLHFLTGMRTIHPSPSFS